MNPSDQPPGVFSALARSLASADEPSVTYRAIAEAAATSLGATVARVWVNDAADGVLTAAGSFGVSCDTEQSLLDVVRVRYGVGIPGHIAVSRTAEFIPDASGDARWVNRRYIAGMGLHAYAGLPLIAGDEVVGVLSILFDTQRDFSHDERARAGLLADCIAIMLRLVRLYDERRRLDALEAVNRLALAVAHEINNPLAVVLGHVELLKEHLRDQSHAADRLRRIEDSATRIANVVRRMNRIVRLEAHTVPSGIPPMLDLERSSGLEATKRRDEHAAFVAHDLRTPLHAISLAVSLLEETPQYGEEQARTLKTLRRNVDVLQQLVTSVADRNVNLPETAAPALERRHLDLWPLTDALIADLHPVAAASETEVINAVPNDLVVYANAGLLRRILQNLLGNALRATPRGHVIVGARAVDADGSFECWVKDDGTGIAEKQLTRIVDMFARQDAPPSTTRLGLAIVNSLVRAHGGTGAVESREGAGSTFRFALPGSRRIGP